MSYDAARSHLARCRRQAEEESVEFQGLIEAIESLTDAVESDLVQIKGALSHLARLIEREREV